MTSCFFSGLFTSVLIIWSLIWIFVVMFMNSERVTKVVLDQITLFLTCTVMPTLGLLFVERRARMRTAQLDGPRQNLIQVGRVIGALAVIFIFRTSFMGHLSGMSSPIVEAVVETVADAQ
jgi:hypothetical protein